MSFSKFAFRARRETAPRAGLFAGLVVAAFSAVAVISACQSTPQQTAQTATPAPTVDPVARGQYLVLIMSCNDCHTPFKMGANGPEPDMSRMLSGHPQDMKMPPPPDLGKGPWGMAAALTNTAWAGPWGVSYTANLTPDTTTGLGAWTEDMFVNAIRNGKHMGTGRSILPPMPWQWISRATDEDLKAIYAYLHSIPAIKNEVPQPVPPDQVGAMGK
jgi:mono/diheme cytochrome c family protein